MGNTIIHTVWFRALILIVLGTLIVFSVVFFFPYTKGLLSNYKIDYYTYTPPKDIVNRQPVRNGPPAVAVPIIMYHGVIEEEDEYNTTIQQFINQMEMLKREGYTTISIKEFDQFRQGTFTLPPKPIIIAFDDGRKDSYYTTDDIFKKLGFKATIFYATGPTLNKNSFYLTFAELRTMKESGRWEIEAHGRNSHNKIFLSPDKTKEPGRYLTSKQYLADKGRVETIAEYEKRVEQDYINGIQDLKKNVGVDPHYYAIPLNDYGQQPISNHPGAIDFNNKMISKYFRLAFIQANDSDNVLEFTLPVYNFANENPFLVRRIEMKNMAAPALKQILERQYPLPADLALKGSDFRSITYSKADTEGNLTYKDEGLYVEAPGSDKNGQIVYGAPHWQNYSVTAEIQRVTGRSVVLLFNYSDYKNYMACGLTDNGFFIRSTVNGKTTELRPSVNIPNISQIVNISASTKDLAATCAINSSPVFQNVAIPFKNGGVGFRVWAETTKAQGILRSLTIKPI